MSSLLSGVSLPTSADAAVPPQVATKQASTKQRSRLRDGRALTAKMGSLLFLDE